MPVAELTDVEVVALSKAMGDARVLKSRAAIGNDKTHKIDLAVRVTGTLTRGLAIADGTKLVVEMLELDWDAIHRASLKKCGIKPVDYFTAHQAATERATKALAKKQSAVEAVEVPTKRRDGDINVALDVIKV